jgi:hypothetical protein
VRVANPNLTDPRPHNPNPHPHPTLSLEPVVPYSCIEPAGVPDDNTAFIVSVLNATSRFGYMIFKTKGKGARNGSASMWLKLAEQISCRPRQPPCISRTQQPTSHHTPHLTHCPVAQRPMV